MENAETRQNGSFAASPFIINANKEMKGTQINAYYEIWVYDEKKSSDVLADR